MIFIRNAFLLGEALSRILSFRYSGYGLLSLFLGVPAVAFTYSHWFVGFRGGNNPGGAVGLVFVLLVYAVVVVIGFVMGIVAANPPHPGRGIAAFGAVLNGIAISSLAFLFFSGAVPRPWHIKAAAVRILDSGFLCAETISFTEESRFLVYDPTDSKIVSRKRCGPQARSHEARLVLRGNEFVNGKNKVIFKIPGPPVSGGVVSPNGRYAITWEGYNLTMPGTVWSLSDGIIKGRIWFRGRPAVSNNGEDVAFFGEDATLYFVRLDDGERKSVSLSSFLDLSLVQQLLFWRDKRTERDHPSMHFVLG